MIEFKIVQAEVEYVRHRGLDSLYEDGYLAVTKTIEQVMAEMVNDGWGVHTIDLSPEYPKALMEREVDD